MAARRTVFITADDFGWTDAQNLAVAQGAAAGTLHRASLLSNGEGFAGAVAVARLFPRLGVGVHLTLAEGRPLTGAAPLGRLCDAEGCFAAKLGPLLRLFVSRQLDVAAVAVEWRAQIERALGAGLRLSHLDGHKHVHLLPPLFDLTLELARRYSIPYIRIPASAPGPLPLRRAVGWGVLRGLALRARRKLRGSAVQTPDHFIGFAYSGAMTTARLLDAILSARPGVTEIMLHPAAETPSLAGLRARYGWARQYGFAGELAALCDPAVRRALDRLNEAGAQVNLR
jgi:predicted glycoside hydrolase/deacetylase ChbG (UPF0249 family)